MSNTDKLSKIIANLGFSRENFSEEMDACNWVMQALDPADEGANGAVTGIPDHSDQPTAVIGWRQIDTIAPNKALGLGESDTWDCDLMLFEGPYVLAAYQMRKTSDASSHYNGWILNRQFNFAPAPGGGPGPLILTDAQNNPQVVNGTNSTNWQQNVASYRPCYASFTGTFNGASLTDQGMLVASQIPNQWNKQVLSNVPIIAPGGATPPPLSTTTMGYTTPLSVVIAGTGTVPGAPISGGGGTTLQQAAVAPAFQTVLQSTPASRSWRGKDGFYIPLRYQDQNLCFQETAESGAVSSLYHPFDMNDAEGTQLPPNAVPRVPSTTGPNIVGLVSKRMRWGVVSWQGLAPTSTFSITARFGYEIMTPVGAPWSANLTSSCKPSDRAVEAYFRIRHDLADAFPSSYNKNALLSKAIDTIVPTVFGALPKGAQKAAKGVTKVVSKVAPKDSKVGKAATAVGKRLKPKGDEMNDDEAVEEPSTGRKGPLRKAIGKRG